ncbi:MAG: PcfB family protein [Lachnospiraceae bacterium]|nr:PcfB family protein [Lachnospiraceae bacterium]
MEELARKIIALSISANKITARVFANAIREYNRRPATLKHGEQTLEELYRSGATLQSIEITAKNIGTFTPVANKYGVDFALKKDITNERYLVFFKAKDINVINQAFSEYAAITAGMEHAEPQQQRVSIYEKIRHYKEQIQKAIEEQRKKQEQKHEKSKEQKETEKPFDPKEMARELSGRDEPEHSF